MVAAAKEDEVILEGQEGAEGEDIEGGDRPSEEEDEEENEEVEESDRFDASGETKAAGEVPTRPPGGRAASIASSYWRPERQDRKGELGGLDDRFEHVAAQVNGR